MTMASRDIANMHFFLDLKKKFPDLPDDVLRSHVSLFSEDQEKCISLLQKESKHHYLSSQPFSDFRLPEGKGNARRNDSNKETAHSMPLGLCSGTSPMPLFVKPEFRSAPVIHNNKEPFADMYRQNSVSSQNTLYHLPSKSGQTMFSTTKEHKIGLPELRTDLIRELPEQSGRHAVKLSIMPSFPFQQQQLVSDSVYAGTSHSSRLGRHTTSVNFQLQPRSSDQRPFVISTIPANIADSNNSGSHVQISVGSRGATFTALRFQHSSHPPVEESSQAQNSYSCLVPDKSPKSGTNSSTQYCPAQASPSYILAVKNEQIAQLDLILNELEKEKAHCSQLRAEVSKLERIAENNISNASFSYVEKLNELREENKRLRTECNCLYIETDMYGSSEIPPCETEDFYSHLFTGPLNGAILPYTTKDLAKRETKPKRGKSEHEDDDEKSRWVCKKCTFANHPALEKCEMCEVSKDIECVDSASVSFPASKGLPPRAAGCVQISITRSPKNLKFHLARKTAR